MYTLNLVLVLVLAGADLGVSREGGGRGKCGEDGFLKKISKILSTFFLGQPSWFSELPQTTIKTLLWPKFLRRSQI